MPTYSKKTWATEEEATSTGLNQMSDNIGLMIRGLIEDRQYAYGMKMVQFDGVQNIIDNDLVFATEAVDGNPNFSVAPIMIITWFQPDGDVIAGAKVFETQAYNITTTQFRLSVVADSIPTSATKRNVGWLAIGLA